MVKLHSYDENSVSFYYIDGHAKQAIWSDVTFTVPFERLVTYLSEAVPRDHAHREVLLTRGFLIWSSANQRRYQSYSQSFKTFCQFAQIECVEIHGKVKGGAYQVGGEDVTSFTWNAFRDDSTWHLVNPHWCLYSVLGGNIGGRVSLEADGKTELKELSSTSGLYVSFFNEDWFCIDPEVFLLTHFPDDSHWQLRSGFKANCAVSYEKWLNLPYLECDFFKYKLQLLSEESCRLKTENGRCSIIFSTDNESLRNLSFSYNISMNASDASGLVPENLTRIVLPERRERDSLFKYDISCPVKGIYFLEIYSYYLKSDDFRECCEFMIECEEPDQNCRKAPVDTGILGFGFGPKAEEAGLKRPSEKGSKIVMEATGSDELYDEAEGEVDGRVEGKEIRFKVDPDAMKEFEYGSCTIEDEREESVPTCLNETTRQLVIDVPARPGTEYALALKQRKKGSGDRFEPVLYYLVTSGEQDNDDNERLTIEVREKRKETKLDEKTTKNASLKERMERLNLEIEKLKILV